MLFRADVPRALQILNRFLDIWCIKAVDNGVWLDKIAETYTTM